MKDHRYYTASSDHTDFADAADPIDKAAKEHFGLDYLYPYQRLVISNILGASCRDSGNDDAPSGQIVILPTGYGKSLCFMLPWLSVAICR